MRTKLSQTTLNDISLLAEIQVEQAYSWLKDWESAKSANPFFQSFFQDSNDFRKTYEIPYKEIQTVDEEKIKSLLNEILSLLTQHKCSIPLALESPNALSANSILSSFCFNNFKIQKGTKYFKTLHKLYPSLHQEITTLELKYSRLAQVRKTGTAKLVFSINPFDFMTLSLNTYKWKSCYRWNSGEHCDSATALLNSPFALIGYIAGSKNWNFSTIANKKWRELFYILPNHIIPVKGYPYQNRPLESKILKILADARGSSFKPQNLKPQEPFQGHIYPYTQFAYDDLTFRENIPYYWNGKEEKENNDIVLDGTPFCPICGSPLEHSNTNYCDAHSGLIPCACCNELFEEESLLCANDSLICEWCFEEKYDTCCKCEKIFEISELEYYDFEPYCKDCLNKKECI